MKRGKGEPPKNLPASVKARLLTIARSRNEDFNAILTRYVLERVLHRLASSSHASDFLLKGAILFTVWSRQPHRATKDIDLLGFGSPDLTRLELTFREVCQGGYRREVAIAEKLHAMVDLGLANSRMKDYSDIWFLARNFDFDGAELASAIRATFERRQTTIPKSLPTGLAGEFAEAPAKLAQWKAFTRRTQLAVDAPTLRQAVDVITSFAGPVFRALADSDSFTGVWPPAGPWNTSSSEP